MIAWLLPGGLTPPTARLTYQKKGSFDRGTQTRLRLSSMVTLFLRLCLVACCQCSGNQGLVFARITAAY